MQLDDARRSAVQRQVEFYFSDSNLPRDMFLREKIDEDVEGFVSIALIISFSRMCKALGLQANTPAGEVSTDLIAQVAEALRDCKSLAVSDDGNRVKRSTALTSPEILVQTQNERSLYAQPFPYDTTLEDLTSIFSKHGEVKCVRMRRHLTSKDFKGSVFVEFADKETAGKVCGMKLEHAGAPLHVEPKIDYMNRKVDERHNVQQNGVHQNGAPAAPANDGVAPMDTAQVAPRTSEGSDAEPQQQAQHQQEQQQQQAGQQQQQQATQQQPVQANDHAEQNAGAQQEANPQVEQSEPGTIVQFDLDEGSQEERQGLHFRAIRPIFGGKEGGVKHCEFKTGNNFGHVRFETAQQASDAVEKLPGDDGKLDICGCSATLRKLEGAEEEKYLRQADAMREAAMQRSLAQGQREDRAFRGGRGRGRGRGGRGGGRGRGRGGRGQKRGNDAASHDGYKLAKTQ